MKLCFLGGTSSTHLKQWIKYFADKGHEIHWVSLESINNSDIKEIGEIRLHLVKRLPLRIFAPLNLLFNAIWIKKLLKEINPDILHAHYAGVVGALGGLSGFHPFVLTVWGSDILILSKSKILKPLVKFSLKKADLITCDAEHIKEIMIKLGANSSKIQIINFGIDTQKFSPGPKDEKLIQKLKLQDSLVVISLRFLDPIYDLETLIKAISLILKEIPKTKFIIAGRGSQEEKLKNLARDLEILESIRFVGWISKEELPKYLRIADVYVSTSLSDGGIPPSTAEAMACELPIVVSDSGDNKIWIKDGENGFIFPLRDSKTLAEKVIYLLKNKSLRLKFAKANRQLIEEKDNYYKEMEKMENIYKELANYKK